MKIFHHYHHRRFYSVIHSDFWKFEFSVWLHMIGWSLISIFIPVLMLRFGYSLKAVILYYFLFNVIDIPLNFLARKLILSLGARLVIILATCSAIVFFAIFNQLATGGWYILALLALLLAIYDTFYWVAQMYLFYESSSIQKVVGKSVGIWVSVQTFGGMLGPSIGALILLFGGQSMLIIASVIFLGGSIIPLTKLHHVRNTPISEKLSLKEFFKELPEKKNYLSWFLYGTHSAVESTLWPVFIFSLFGTLESIAFVAFVVSISKIGLAYFSGSISTVNRDKVVILSTLLAISVWISRLLYQNHIFYYASILLMGLIAILVEVPLDSSLLERSKVKGSLDIATFRNTSGMLPQVFLFGFLALIVGVFRVSFIIAIVALFGLMLVTRLFLALTNKQVKLEVSVGNKAAN